MFSLFSQLQITHPLQYDYYHQQEKNSTTNPSTSKETLIEVSSLPSTSSLLRATSSFNNFIRENWTTTKNQFNFNINKINFDNIYYSNNIISDNNTQKTSCFSDNKSSSSSNNITGGGVGGSDNISDFSGGCINSCTKQQQQFNNKNLNIMQMQQNYRQYNAEIYLEYNKINNIGNYVRLLINKRLDLSTSSSRTTLRNFFNNFSNIYFNCTFLLLIILLNGCCGSWGVDAAAGRQEGKIFCITFNYLFV